jgi:putative flavoprotein involved in K+ transport
MTMPEVIDQITRYAKAIAAPVRANTTVTGVAAVDGGSRVETDQGVWRSQTVVLASGACNIAKVPAVAEAVPGSVASYTPLTYRRPDQLDEGGVLIVGASATGVQLAEEIQRSGRPVTLAVGEHVRLPRSYRGRDILWWMEASGVLDESYRDVDDLVRARNVPSPQLVGTPGRATIDLNALSGAGVRLVGRLAGVSDGRAQLSGSLLNLCTLADLKMNRLLGTLDEWADEAGVDDVDPPQRFEPTSVEAAPPLSIDLTSGEIRSVIWATGFRPDYSWLGGPVFDRKGMVRHDGGVVTDAPGLYLLGTTFLRRRRSSFISGAGPDTADLAAHLHQLLDGRSIGRRGTA